mmetsp:Transcript_23920/g.68716  ORF Transcript_23920/g.68716 Transcript_23920/m.68716 type:complete len:756 (-) Transcript_23920:246-2513(-)|eukprot:CAMPEP_0181042230 /NCGR_PEP_ID=MMETSP1070-20121207/12038_1 /TAXON_ID=265543 /ORGANISM="Minutocellus polymorphus, Strain NH13" /LENGTH=755 /DNA_ID=CAMNT_0023120427 /DNA_START=215 /DNA_END=2482 /DNA_ORIENTATION=-
MSTQNTQKEGGSSSHHEGLLSLSPRSELPVSPHSEGGASRNQQLKGGASTLGGMMAINVSLCAIGRDGSTTTSVGRSGGSSQAPTSSEDNARRAKFASALHLSMSNGGKSPRSPSHSSLGIDISRLPPMQISSEDAYEDSSSNQSDDDDEEPTKSPRASAIDWNSSSGTDGRRGRRVHRVLAEAASSPSLGSIDDNKSGASPRSFNLQPRPNRHSPSPNESALAGASPSAVVKASADRSVDSSCARPPSSFGRISPHLHLDLSCVAVPPLNTFSSSYGGTRCRSDSEATLGSKEDSTASVAAEVRQPPQQVGSARPSIEPPPWAVAAKGEAKLEPVCESLGVQRPMDLTTQACFRVGRSPTSDLQLLHATSSRRHALLFHHPNGSCYVVDCGSAHGTFINGERVKSAVVANSNGASNAGSNGASGMVIPHRVRRGALLRFGGPGAPCFILKSFAVKFDELCGSADSASEYSCGTLLSSVNQSLASEVTRRLLGGALPKNDHSEIEASRNESSSSSNLPSVAVKKPDCNVGADNVATESAAALLQINTRVNALSGMASLGPEERRLAQNAASRLLSSLRSHAHSNAPSSSRQLVNTSLGKHSLDVATRPGKRMKLAVDSQVHPKSPNPVLVSPVTVRQNIFASPVPCSSTVSRLSALTETPIRPILSVPLSVGGSRNPGKGEGDSTPPLRRNCSRDPDRKVKFSDQVDSLYAASITPDELSIKDNNSFEDDDDTSSSSRVTRHHPPKTPRALLKQG